MQKLRFHARGTACVPDPHGTEMTPQRRRMVARKHAEISPGSWAWVPAAEAEEADYHHDLAKACRDGDLWPADKETAAACGVPFDPKFGGGEVSEKPAKGGKEQV